MNKRIGESALVMKSSQEQLIKRGFADKEVKEKLSGLSEAECIKWLHSKDPVMRTAAASSLCTADELVTEELLKQLAVEKCLYTKIAICESLQKGNLQTANQIVKFLSKIGKNQYKKLPSAVSKKKSFPLPRDIAARTLGKMDISVLPALLKVINQDERMKIAEALDAIGFMVFYHQELAVDDNLKPILLLIDRSKKDKFILWKCILCLSAFPLMESKEYLASFMDDQSILGKEAARSLSMIMAREHK